MANAPTLTVLNRNRQRIGILDNAYNISVEREVNNVCYAKFSLPMDDAKNELCTHMNYVEVRGKPTAVNPLGKYYGLYRIMPTETSKAVQTNRISYELEHVITTLLDDVIDGLLPALVNRTTEVNLRRLLNLQETPHWQLGRCDFERYFQYAFENENGLLAPILSIAEPFDEPFEYQFDTTSYPWTINLIRPSDDTRAEVRWGKDMISFDEKSDPTEIVNYIIPKGYGEGVNQLTIKDVNGGRTYLQDTASIAKWSKRPYIWIDRRFKDAESLKASAKALLDKWKEPKISFELEAADLSILPEFAHEQRHLNGVVRIIVEDKTYYGRIISEKIPDLSKEYEVEYQIANRLDDIATIQADVERKQQVNEAYSQGATNILAFNYQDNCDSNIPAKIPFYIDDDVMYVNTLELTLRTEPFRAYSRATEGGGALVKSTKGGGGTTRSTTSGGSTTQSTTNGGATTQTSSSGGGTSSSTGGGGSVSTSSGVRGFTGLLTTTFPFGVVDMETHTHNVNLSTSQLEHSHSISIPPHTHSFSVSSHTHSVSIPAHSHSVTIPAHSHNVTIPDHTHEIELPNHTHEVKHEIVELSSTPSSLEIRVDGNLVPHTSTSGNRIDLSDYIDKDSDTGKITRGRHEITIRPNGLVRVEADLIMRVFILSNIGENL